MKSNFVIIVNLIPLLFSNTFAQLDSPISMTPKEGEIIVNGTAIYDSSGHLVHGIEDTLLVLGGAGNPGTSGNIVPIYLNNSKGLIVIDFAIVDIPNYLTITDIKRTERVGNDFSIFYNDEDGHIFLFNLSLKSIPPGRGTILNLIYDVDLNADTNKISLELQNVNLIDTSKQEIPEIVTVNGIFEVPVPVSVELVNFGWEVRENNVILNWITLSESNNYGFEIEKSNQEDKWNRIGFVAGYGNSTKPHHYHFIDKIIENAICYYRLKQLDIDGTFKYSNVIKATIEIPKFFFLSQNCPNPVNPTTTINFSLPQSNFVTLKLFDVSGREVITLLNEKKQTGIFSLTFDASNLPSGMYFYKFQAGNFVEIKKMIVLK